MGVKLDQNEILTLLDKLYDRSIKGLPMVSPPIETLANDYWQRSKGVIDLGKMIPVVGGAISGGFDLVETRIIAARAHKMFVKGEPTASADTEEDIEIIEAL